MKLDLALWADRIDDKEPRTAVVIDVLRASSTIITALSNGAEEVIPTANIKAARKKQEQIRNSLVAGERNGVKIEDFDLGNSPLNYDQEKIAGKRIILTTTNGTKCFNHLGSAQEVIIASLLNITAVTDYLGAKEEILLCCAGNHGDFAIDDVITAGKIIVELKKQYEVDMTDKCEVAEQLYLYNQSNLLQALLNSESGGNLIKLGYKEDIEYIATERKDIVPIYHQGTIR